MSKNESILILNKAREASSCAEANCASSFTNATNAATSATNAANSAAAAAESAEIAGIYLGPKAVAPTTDNEGGPLQEGMLYFNTVSNGLFVWNGSAWVSADFNEFTNFTATGTTTARNLVTRFSDVVNVKDFGAVGDGASDDTAAIQAAVNTGKNVYFPTGKYRTTSTITVSTRGQGLFGDGGSIGGKGGITTNNFGSIIQLDIPDVAPATAMFLITESQITFNCLKFQGDAGNTNDIGLLFQKITNTDDVDGYVYDCEFYELFSPIYFYGRALHADKNVFSSLNGGDSITLDWPASGTSGGDLQQGNEYKGRAQRITNNRFHGGNYAVTVKNYIQRSPIYSNNCIDIGQGFIDVEGTAGMSGAIIDGNVADLCSSVPISFRPLSTSENVVISNNKLGGAIAGIVDGSNMRPFTSIRFDGLSKLENTLISGNTICGTSAGAITISNDSASPVVNPINFVVTNNVIDSVGLDTNPNRFVFNSVYDINGFIFTNNTASNLGATVVSVIRSSSDTFTNIVVKNNIWNQAIPLFTTTSFTAPFEIDHKIGGYGINTSGSFVLGDQGAYSSSIPFVLNRTTSTSGVGTRYNNSLGYVDIFSSPTGVGSGAFTPGSDNLVSLGSGSLRWSQLYAGTNVINTSDEREKQQIRSLSEAEKKVAIKLKSLVKVFKFNNAVEAKGENARIHVGVIAQEIVAAFESEGLDATKYGLLCYDEWDEQPEEKDSDGNIIQEYIPAGNRYGIRYDQLLAFIISAI